MPTARIIGTGSYLPEMVVKNTDFEKMMDTSDEWISTRTGIRERHFSQGMENWEMGLHAARRALEAAGTEPGELALIVGTTITPDYYYPGLSNLVQAKLGATNAFCFDVAAACNGFVTALDIVWQFLRSGRVGKALIVSSEQLSKTLDFSDRSTCVLFGDGAGAAVLAPDERGIRNVANFSEADLEGVLACPALPPKSPFLKEDAHTLFAELAPGRLHMGGRETYKFATRALPGAIRAVLEGTGVGLDELRYIVPHQANLRIIQTAAEHLGVSMDKMVVDIDKYGNTSSATMPIALDELARAGKLSPGDKIVFAGFGGGFNYGAALLEW